MIDVTGRQIDLQQLADELTAAGVAHRALGTSIDEQGRTLLHTYTANGQREDLPAAAAPVVAAHLPPPPPAVPDYGSDLQAPREFAEQAAVAVANLRAYLALPTPTGAQTTAAVKLLCRIAIYLIRQQAR